MLKLLKVYDSRGNPTVMAEFKGLRAFAPAGKSTGKHEVITFPLKEGKPSIKLGFKFFEEHKKQIENAFEMSSQRDFDNFLKEISNNLLDIGGSISIALSMLFLKYSAFKEKKQVYEYLTDKPQLPKPLGNVLGGGLHSHNNLPVQEILITHLDDTKEAIKKNIDVYKEMESLLLKRGFFFGKNDEGAISTNISFRDALYLVKEASHNLDYNTKIGLDLAANSFYRDGEYYFEGKVYDESSFKDYLLELLNEFKNILYLEDPFYEESFDAFAELQKQTDVLICGDDLYTTNVKRLSKGIAKNATKAVLIKPNQIGTITDTYETVKLAKENELTTVISHRSGETCDFTIAHLAVGWQIPYIKTGTISGERLAKLNELIYIESRLN